MTFDVTWYMQQPKNKITAHVQSLFRTKFGELTILGTPFIDESLRLVLNSSLMPAIFNVNGDILQNIIK